MNVTAPTPSAQLWQVITSLTTSRRTNVQDRVVSCAFTLLPLVRAALLLRRSVPHVLLREQDDSTGGAVQPQGQKGGPVARVGETIGQRSVDHFELSGDVCGAAVVAAAVQRRRG